MRIDFCWIEPDRLAASSLPSTLDDLRWLKSQGIRAIVTLTEDPLTDIPPITAAHFAKLGIATYHAPIDDMRAPKEADFTHNVMEFIYWAQSESKPVLVHCLAGVGRTGTMLHSYFLHRGLSIKEAQLKVLDLRPLSCWRELTSVQQMYLLTLAARLKK